MKKTKSFIFGLIVTFVILAILPAYVIFCVVNSYIVSDSMILFLVVFFAISLLFVLIKKIPNIIKVIFPILILLATVIGAFFLLAFGGNIEFRALDNEKEISEYYSDFDYDKYGEYENISNYKYHSTGIFQQEAYTTILKYNKDSYEKQKSIIDKTYVFYNDKNFSQNDFDFRISVSGFYPKELEIIGINDKTCEIAYIIFKDQDLDYIESLDRFLTSYCGWQYVVKERLLDFNNK